MADEKVSNNLVQRLIFLQVSFAFWRELPYGKNTGFDLWHGFLNLAKASESRTYILPHVNLP